MHATQSQGYVPIAAKGHKESVYALATNDRGTLLVSGGTEKVSSGCLSGMLINIIIIIIISSSHVKGLSSDNSFHSLSAVHFR